MTTVCPKCGYHQNRGPECFRCGLLFARYRPEEERPAFRKSGFRLFRAFRWMALTLVLSALALAARKADPPVVKTDPAAGASVEKKLKQTQRALQRGQSAELRLNEAEVNSWLGDNLEFSEKRTASLQEVLHNEMPPEAAESAVRDVRMKLYGDLVQTYLVFNFHGKDLSLSLSGRVRTDNGHVRLEPVSGRLGSLPIPLPALRQAVDRVFSSPENEEKFRLPEEVVDLSVQDGEIVVMYRENTARGKTARLR